jgi:hypothetical protein
VKSISENVTVCEAFHYAVTVHDKTNDIKLTSPFLGQEALTRTQT